ncbi:uncharacterized protein LOC142544223 [Primulina tabacum]|uniref:uncharacterized protein LOC142544223 n=1 Tax=Primulina tabacum TaxID=48773 RepID=UPI003F59B487
MTQSSTMIKRHKVSGDVLQATTMTIIPQQKDDAARRKGLSPLQKCTTAIRQLAYGDLADHLDEYLCMGESTVIKCLFKFCGHVVELFGDRSLRRPNDDDVQRLLQMHYDRHGFHGMLGSLNCMNWEWNNCLVA